MPLSLLAHAGAGASWQALVAVLCWLVAVLFILAITKVVKIQTPGDLVLPLAGIVIVSSLGTSASDTLSDQIGWSLPVGIVALAGLVAASMKPDEWTIKARPAQATIVVAAVAALALNGWLTSVLHPAPEYFDVSSLPVRDDVELDITAPEDRSTVGTSVTLVVEVTGGTVGGQLLAEDDAPADPEELGLIRILDGASVLAVTPRETCSAEAPCTTLTYDLELAPGKHQILAEFLTATGTTFRSSVFSLVVLTVE